MRCKRHGRTVVHLVQGIREGRLGMCSLFRDSDEGDRTARQLPPAIPHNRGTAIAQQKGRHMIPKVIFLPHTDMHRLHTAGLAALTTVKKTVVCIEVGHTADRRLAAVTVEKIQHIPWLQHLVEEGWKLQNHPVVVSHSGLVASMVEAALQACGAAPPRGQHSQQSHQTHSLDYDINIWAARKALYCRQQQDPPDAG